MSGWQDWGLLFMVIVNVIAMFQRAFNILQWWETRKRRKQKE